MQVDIKLAKLHKLTSQTLKNTCQMERNSDAYVLLILINTVKPMIIKYVDFNNFANLLSHSQPPGHAVRQTTARGPCSQLKQRVATFLVRACQQNNKDKNSARCPIHIPLGNEQLLCKTVSVLPVVVRSPASARQTTGNTDQWAACDNRTSHSQRCRVVAWRARVAHPPPPAPPD